MYSTCLFCNHDLGRNDVIPTFAVGTRLAFDPERGRLWVVCRRCDRWNLTPLEERWEAVEECERLFRATRLRYSTGNVGLAQLRSGVDLVRIGRALRPEIAAWRYGRLLGRWLPRAPARGLVRQAYAAADGSARLADRVIDVVGGAGGAPRATIRYRHVGAAALTRPERGQAWQLVVPHDDGVVTLAGTAGLRTAGRLLAGINRVGVTSEAVGRAVRKIEDAGNPDDFFNRVVVGIALRTSWGRVPFTPPSEAPVLSAATDAERLALYLTSRSFWGRGAIGSEPRTLLPQLPLVDRLALEMAAHEDIERQALEGELAALAAAWAEAEEIAAIADGLLLEAVSGARWAVGEARGKPSWRAVVGRLVQSLGAQAARA